MTHPVPHVDSIAVTLDRRADPIRRALDELLTRSFYSGAGYVFECDPFAQPEDADVFAVLSSIREGDRRHAHVLGGLIEARGAVPSTGVFPWWNLDLNYLTVPCLSRFVLESLREELPKYDALVAQWPSLDAEGRAALSLIRAEKAKQVEELEPVVLAAEKREVDAHASKIAAVKKTREARIAKEKAAAEAAKKAKQAAAAAKTAPAAATAAAGAPVAAKAPAAALGDPNEPGISRRERGRRLVLQMRQMAGKPLSLLPSAPAAGPVAAPAPTAAVTPAAAPAAGGALLDPNEPGIAPKEKARRQMLKMRAASGAPAPAAPVALADPAAAAAPAPTPVAAAPSLAGADLLDPNEPGISPKEKARRQVAKNRAAGGGPAPSAAPAPVAAAPAAAAPAPAPVPVAEAPAALPADLGDPSEPGISPKEKARRQMARMRAQKG